jgi:hypothetical protein
VTLRYGCYLSRLNPEAAQLDLVIGSPNEFKPAVDMPSDQVTAPVEPLAGRAEGVRNKSCGSKAGVPQIAASYTRAANVQFAGHAYGDEVHVTIKHERPSIPDRIADRHRAAPNQCGQHVVGGDSSRLGRTICVDNRKIRQRFAQPPHVGGRHCFTTGNQQPQRTEETRIGVNHQIGELCGQEKDAHLLRCQQRAQLMRLHWSRRVDDQPGTMGKRHPDLDRGRVERCRGEQQEGVVGSGGYLGQTAGQPDDALLLNRHPLGLTGGSRCVHHVPEVGRPRLGPRGSCRRRRELTVQDDELGVVRKAVSERLLRERDPRAAGGQDQPDPFRRIAEVNREVSRARLRDAEQCGHEHRVAFQADRYQVVRAASARAEKSGDPARGDVQFPVAHRTRRGRDRHAIGSQLNGARHHLLDRLSRRFKR